MPRQPQPFFRRALNCWYVQLGSKQIRLDPDEATARRLYHELMARPPEERRKPEPLPTLAVEVMDAFLGWVNANKAKRTFDWYHAFIQKFASSIPPTLPVAELTPYHVTRVMDAETGWSNNTKHDFGRAVQRAFTWAAKQKLILVSPLVGLEKPSPEARELAISPADFELVMTHARGPFRELVRFAWESGVRPQEIRIIEARHVDFEQARIVFPKSESKGKKSSRVVYLTPEASAILAPLCKRHPTGVVFRNSQGNAWTKDAINCGFERLGKKIGRKLHLGAFRKGYCTEALKNGLDTVTVSRLMGHANAVMVSRIYGQVQQDPAFMAEAARRARGGKSE